MTYKSLNLPLDPIKNTFNIDSIQPDLIVRCKVGYIQFDPKVILKEEIIDTFESNNLKLSSVVIFRVLLPRLLNNSLMHSDIESIRHNAWKKVICSVNWELTSNVQPKFSWYQTTKEAIMPSKESLLRTDITLFGVHYGGRQQLGVNPDKDTLIDTVSTSTGVFLVRTDIPHIVEIDDEQPKFRYALSARFENRFKSWDEAVEIFQPLIK